ncbi:hypothetical protein [uncultured Sphingomonas sp.]|uniref:hypothetical protein n=1 Tax=uncultured Sphingomonas sp. TaxID=158754 RepID=UPI0025EDB14F|nr:hypothetical protein [uncultured Sphingomonas sp.]
MIFLVPCASAHSGRIGTLKHNLSVQINPAITGQSAAVGQGHYQELAQASDTARISRACNPSLGKERQVPSKATALDFPASRQQIQYPTTSSPILGFLTSW